MNQTAQPIQIQTPSSKGVDLPTQVQYLHQQVQGLQEIFSNNTTVFAEALDSADASLQIFQRVLHDMIRNEVHTCEIDDGIMGIDYQYYFDNYIACMGLTQFCKRIMAINTSESPQDPYNGAPLFGGDFR